MRWRRSERERAADSHELNVHQRRIVWAACASLLEYPTAALRAGLPALQEALADLPPAYAKPLNQLATHLRSGDLREHQMDYVDTFDHTRRCALYLTYFAYGDTRRRGVALVQFKQAYRRGGVEFDEERAQELPDHLCVVLQFGAQHDPAGAWTLLLDHRAAVEMLRLALLDAESPWAKVLEALCKTLPALKGDEADAVRRLISEGPPAEEVGLAPYASDPTLSSTPPSAQPEFLGMPG